ncbi:MAG: S8 family serine peptidase, partial [Actinomycetota bacterium]
MTIGPFAHALAPAGTAATMFVRHGQGRRPGARASIALVTALAFGLLGLGAQLPAGSTDVGLGIRWFSAGAAAKVEPGVNLSTPVAASVIVQAEEGRAGEARAAITEAGGTVGADLSLVNGYEATLTGPQTAAVAADGAVRSVSVNRRVKFENLAFDETTTASNFAKTSEATTAWAVGNLGTGVGVAVLDTGVSSMRDFSGRLAFGPDLSGEGTTVDSHGHGTVMAGIVAGNGADSAGRTGGAYTGVAPGATLVSVKVAGRNGVVDVSTMLQGMHWVSAYKDQFNIRVMNLSWGTTSTQNPSLDPLNYAVQRLWRQGIVVVVAAGNSGPQAGTVTKPGDDPMVVTVG